MSRDSEGLCPGAIFRAEMKLRELESKSILILGFGAEGQATYEYLRKHWPEKPLSSRIGAALTNFPMTSYAAFRTMPPCM